MAKAQEDQLGVLEPQDDNPIADYGTYKRKYFHSEDRPQGLPEETLKEPPDGWACGGHMVQDTGINYPSVSRPLLLSPDHAIADKSEYRAGWDPMPRRVLALPDAENKA